MAFGLAAAARPAHDAGMRLAIALVLLLLAVPPARAEPGLRLLMVETEGCVYCREWDRAVGPDYPASPAGRAAPLMRVDLRGPWPDGLVLDRGPVITPTFILLRNGVELGRLEGYLPPPQFHAAIGGLLGQAGRP